MKSVISIKTGFILILLKVTNTVFAQEQMPQAIVGSFPDYFRYFDPNDPSILNPQFTNLSNGVVGMYSNPMHKGATGFFIRTFRNDNKVCFCTAGHVVDDYLHNPTLGSVISFDIYMNYLGTSITDEDGDHLNETISGFRATPRFSELVAYAFNPNELNDESASPSPDMALLLIDRRFLPTDNYTELGYDFDYDVHTYQGLLPDAYFFTIGHPHSWPQRLADHLSITNVKPNTFRTVTWGNNNLGSGISGAPLARRTNTASVVGIVNGGVNPVNYIDAEIAFQTDFDDEIDYSNRLFHTKINLLKNAIVANCWQNKTIAELEGTKEYQQTMMVDNSQRMQGFKRSIAISSATQLASLTTFTENAPSGTVNKIVEADNLTINYDIGSTTDNIYGQASNIWLGDGFSYISGNSGLLELNAIIINQSASTSTLPLPDGTDKAAYANRIPLWDTLNKNTSGNNPFAVLPGEGFGVRPNPSNEGIFYISTPKNFSLENYSVEIHDMAGRSVKFKKKSMQAQLTIDLTNTNPGSFVLTIKQNGYTTYKTILIYND